MEKANILVVDDDKEIVELVGIHLQQKRDMRYIKHIVAKRH